MFSIIYSLIMSYGVTVNISKLPEYVNVDGAIECYWHEQQDKTKDKSGLICLKSDGSLIAFVE